MAHVTIMEEVRVRSIISMLAFLSLITSLNGKLVTLVRRRSWMEREHDEAVCIWRSSRYEARK